MSQDQNSQNSQNSQDSLLQQQMRGLHPKVEFTRRGFITTALGSGFAAAVLPVSAATITTDSTGLTAGEVKIPTPDGNMPAYRAKPGAQPGAQPEGKGNLPTIIVIQEIFGVHEHIKDLCRRFAKLGYLAIAPDLYARYGDATKITAIPELFSTIVSRVDDSEVAGDIDATLAWIKANGGNADKVGVTGFCWGGRQVWLQAARSSQIKAGVAWYGPLTGTPNDKTPRFPVDLAAELKAPVLGLYGGKDQAITAAHVEAMRQALKKAPAVAADSSIVVYPDAQHGFNADYRPSYDEKDARDAWAKMRAFFKAHGVA